MSNIAEKHTLSVIEKGFGKLCSVTGDLDMIVDFVKTHSSNELRRAAEYDGRDADRYIRAFGDPLVASLEEWVTGTPNLPWFGYTTMIDYSYEYEG